jgi:hypothetical protein
MPRQSKAVLTRIYVFNNLLSQASFIPDAVESKVLNVVLQQFEKWSWKYHLVNWGPAVVEFIPHLFYIFLQEVIAFFNVLVDLYLIYSFHPLVGFVDYVG